MAEHATQSHAKKEESATADDVARLLLSRRLEDFITGTRLAFVPTLGSAAALIYMFYDLVPVMVLGAWAALQLFWLSLTGMLARRIDPATAPLGQLDRQWHRLMLAKGAGALTWAFIFPYLATVATGLAAAVLAVISMAILSAAVLVHRTSPFSARVHIVALSLAMSAATVIQAGWAGWPALILLAIYALALAGSVRAQDRQALAGAEAEIARRESAGTVRMLLHDYEEQSSDWLWTVNREGRLRDVSARFAMAADRPAQTLEDMPLIDLFLPGEDRDRLASHLRDRNRFRDLVVKVPAEDAIRYWKLSARPRSDGRMSGVARDVTGDRVTEDRVAFMAHYDNLTGLANRYLFNDRLRAALAQEEQARSVVLFYLDLDDFKAVNDTRGHLLGDRLLREVGTRLEQEVRGHDLVARLGGDEFAILLETRAGAGMLIERAHRFLAVIREPFELDGQTSRISGS
ncbi:MAG: diguanylate cyclase, partial [Pseudomonadota bacterium]|nr:diguanylate cyclase [Pseudomonadota bacterium]